MEGGETRRSWCYRTRAVRVSENRHLRKLSFRELNMPETGFTRTVRMANPRRPVKKKVLCSALVYTPLAGLHRTNSPETRLQQPVAPRNKFSQHTLLCTPIAGRIRPIYASHTPLQGRMERE